ncbi:hypothetical protein BOX15_Mlig004930g4, partial [Macrostomum lignano]
YHINKQTKLAVSMGGDSHGHGTKWIPPDWRQYKIQDAPRVQQHVDRLAAIGLKDPWARNEVWRYHSEFYKPPNRWIMWLITRGAPYGIAAFGTVIVLEKLYGYVNRKHGHDGHAKHH